MNTVSLRGADTAGLMAASKGTATAAEGGTTWNFCADSRLLACWSGDRKTPDVEVQATQETIASAMAARVRRSRSELEADGANDAVVAVLVAQFAAERHAAGDLLASVDVQAGLQQHGFTRI